MNEKNRNIERIIANIKNIKRNIKDTALKCNRDPEQVKIIGVTKNRTITEIDSAIKAGITYIGENKVQEAESKLTEINESFDEFHFIGHLQRNKVNKLMSLKPTLIHSIDSLRTVRKLDQYLQRHNMQQDILIQVNTSDETSKFGLSNDYEELKSFIKQISQFATINIKGLMTLAVYSEDQHTVRQCFIRLRNHLERINKDCLTERKLDILSMGMSNDYITAIEEGSTIVRIGSSIFR